MKIIDFVKGVTFHKRSKDSVFFQELKKILTLIGVPFTDPCCDTETGIGAMRFNNGLVEHYDAATGLWVTDNSVESRTATAINVTDDATANELLSGVFTSTSAAAVTITLPDVTDIATAVTVDTGSTIDFIVDNSAGANTVTVDPGTGITVVTPIITGSDDMDVASGDVGLFKLIFTSSTTAVLARIV